MSAQGDFDIDSSQRTYKHPYTARHPIPTVQRYREEHGDEVQEHQKQAERSQEDEQDDSKTKRAFHSVKAIFTGEEKPTSSDHDPYPATSRNTGEDTTLPPQQQGNYAIRGDEHDTNDEDGRHVDQNHSEHGDKASHRKQAQRQPTATESAASETDPRKKRKNMKHKKRDDGGREVTDPVTHLPVIIRDSTTKDLENAPENEPESGSQPRSQTGLNGPSKSKAQLDCEQQEIAKGHEGMLKVFPPPNFEEAQAELVRTYQLALSVGIGAVVVLATLALVVIQLFGYRTQGFAQKQDSNLAGGQARTSWSFLPIGITILLAGGFGVALITTIRGWLGTKVQKIWEDEVWDAARQEEARSNESELIMPESVQWLNSLLGSVWPLINPDLFTSLADMLEDVMQASLPKLVRMVSVDDLGQGSEAIRILGIRWLPTGAASQSVDSDGNLKGKESQGNSDRAAPGQGEIEKDNNERQRSDSDDADDSPENKQKKKEHEETEEAIREGMEAEQGDFVNMELAFAYRSRSSGKSLKAKAKNAHLYLKFYLPGGIAIPVWVELRGIIGTMRLRLQLTPDPPFFSVCTLTFLGQPRADLSCVPLSKHSLNVMDVPMISSFVQSSIDAALAEYVAPKSLTLDLKDMLVGDDFKKNTLSRGVVLVFIKQARGFKEGDGGIGPFGGASDSYVTVSWGKFGKPVASTRIIEHDQEPNWHEWSHILVSTEEISADEKLRIQLWDSDKWSADDDLGRVEVDLKELMYSPKTQNKMCDREDRFVGQDPDEEMPGTLTWSVGYFSKAKITEDQLAAQTQEPEIKTKEDLMKKVSQIAEAKLREATSKDEGKEIKQQKQQDYMETEDALIISTPPPEDYPSGIFSIQIHNITGLEIEQTQKKDNEDSGVREDEGEQGDNMPDSYCTIIINHQKVYQTRTKPKNAKPFFNAGTEKFLRDWKSTEVIISVRDSRQGENDALLGIIYLPLREVFKKRSQTMDRYPVVGGVGYGRARISMVFRSVELHIPKELAGWDYGTLEIKAPVRIKGDLAQELQNHRIKLRSNLARVKMYAQDGEWKPRGDRSQEFLPVRKRYSSALIVEFRKSSIGPDSTPAFAVFWLSGIPDEEEKTVTMKVWKGGKDNIKRATTSCDYRGLEQDEQCLGEIEVTLKFWRGLSGYHKRYANKNTKIRDTMEVLDTVNDEEQDNGDEGTSDGHSDDSEGSDNDNSGGPPRARDGPGGASDLDNGEPQSTRDKIRKKLKPRTNQDSSDSGADDDGSSSKNPITKTKSKIASLVDGHNDPNDGSRGVLAQYRDYKDHHKQIHRKHRGVMQWKGARTMNWVADKAKRTKGRVEGVFEHKEKDSPIETEV